VVLVRSLPLGLALLAACSTPLPDPGTPPICAVAPPPDGAPSSQPTSLPAAGTTQHPATLIRGATVWTAAGQILQRTDVRFEAGRITAIGRGLTPAANDVVIDARGKHLTPGLIDPHSHLGIFSVPGLKAHRDGNEQNRTLSADLRAEDAIWPQDPAISRALAAGVTTALVLPGSANLFGGRGAVIKLIPGRSVQDLLFPGAPPSLKMACGENPKHYGGASGPNTRMGSVARVRQAFTKARIYQRTWRRHKDKLKRWTDKRARLCDPQRAKRRTRKKDGSAQPPKPPKHNPLLETLVEVLEGRLRVQWHCYRADEMLAMLRLAAEQGFTVQAFHHATEAYKIRDALRRAGTAAVTWVHWWGFKAEAYDTIPENAALLTEQGALAALHSDSPVVIQRLNQEAALAYHRGKAAGLPITRDQALQLVTRTPARVIGIDALTGSIEQGKAADLVLWSGEPFSVYSVAEQVWIDGVLRHRRGQRRPSDFELALVPQPALLPPGAQTLPHDKLPKLGPVWTAAAAAPRVAAAGADHRPAPPALAIVGARIETMTADAIDDGVVVIQGGRISAVGRRGAVKVPAGARVIQARGKLVTPGLIAADAALGLVDISAEPSARDHLPSPKTTPPVRAALRVWDGLNPHNPAIPINRAQGFTTAVIRPFGGLVSGQAAAFDLDGLTPAEIALSAPVAMVAHVGLAGAKTTGGSRALALSRLRRLLDDARLLKQKRAAAQARRLRRLSAPLVDLEALIPVVEGRTPLYVQVQRAADILAVLRFAKQQRGVRVVLSGVAEGWRVAKRIAAARVPVLVGVDVNLPRSFEALGSRFDNAARLHRAGVVVGFSAAGNGMGVASHNPQHLRQLAGIAVARGLPHRAALAALTSVPAQIFGLQDRGVIKPGARGNVVLWSRPDPLELSTQAELVIVGGREVSTVTRQMLLLRRYRTLPPR
jgi:imidazolonepropionase-like amidohydrolase